MPLLISLIHAPAEKLCAPLAIGITCPDAVFAVTVIAFPVADFLGGNVKHMLHLFRNRKGRGKNFLFFSIKRDRRLTGNADGKEKRDKEQYAEDAGAKTLQNSQQVSLLP